MEMGIGKSLLCAVGAMFALAAVGSGVAQAQASRTWVSGVGDDANPCSRTAPCKTFAGAISKTAAGGEIDLIDPGGFGAVTITKAMTIVMQPGYGGILNAATNGINISAGVNDVIVLRGLQIQGAGSGLTGVRFLNGGGLILQDCVINSGPGGFGVDFSPSGASTLNVVNTYVTNNGTTTGPVGGGIVVRPTGGTGSAVVNIKNSNITRNTFGIRGEGATAGALGVKITISDSEISSNGFGGIIALTTASPVTVLLDNVVSSNNGTIGVNANGSGAIIAVGDSTITGNGTGILAQNSGAVVSFGDNQLVLNGANGSFSSTTPLQ
jgi:hypothetical protein